MSTEDNPKSDCKVKEHEHSSPYEIVLVNNKDERRPTLYRCSCGIEFKAGEEPLLML